LNGDSTTTNYQKQLLSSNSTPAVAAIALNAIGLILGLGTGMLANEPVGFTVDIQNYLGGFYKTMIQTETAARVSSSFQGISSEGIIWENTDAIDRITLQASSGVLLDGSRATLYGRR
jgi:hypothetical protein